MSNIPAIQSTTDAIESALIQGDLSKLSPVERLSYYKSVCESLGLNPLTKPFDYILLKGKLTLYPKRDCTDQLRQIKKVSITIVSRENVGDVYVVTARARDFLGREDESTGAVPIAGLRGEDLANAYMKAETKAKRRVTLSVCGLGLPDESEVASIAGAQVVSADDAHSKAIGPKLAEAKPVVEQKAAASAEEKPARTKKEVGAEIMAVANELALSKEDVAKWAFEDFKKPSKDLTLEEMETLLGTFQSELGKRGAL